MPHRYAALVHDFMTVEDKKSYQSKLPEDRRHMMHHFTLYFAYLEQFNYQTVNCEFNVTISFEVQKVIKSEILSPALRGQTINAMGNVAYLIQVLEDFADYPFEEHT